MSTSSCDTLKNGDCFSLEIRCLLGELYLNIIYQKCKLHVTPGGPDYSNYFLFTVFFFKAPSVLVTGESVCGRGVLLFPYLLSHIDLYG